MPVGGAYGGGTGYSVTHPVQQAQPDGKVREVQKTTTFEVIAISNVKKDDLW